MLGELLRATDRFAQKYIMCAIHEETNAFCGFAVDRTVRVDGLFGLFGHFIASQPSTVDRVAMIDVLDSFMMVVDVTLRTSAFMAAP
jgi:hypothetical protein